MIFKDAKWQMVQIRTTPELKEGIMLFARRKGFTLSCLTRMTWAKMLEDSRLTEDKRTIQPIENAVNGVKEYLPVMDPAWYNKKY